MSNNNESEESSRCNRRNLAIGITLAVLILGVVVGLSVYFTRPANVPAIQAQAKESLPSLIKAAPVEKTNGAFLIQKTQSLDGDENQVFYYLDLQDLEFGEAFASAFGVEDPNNLVLYLTESADPTVDDISKTKKQRKLFLRQLQRDLEKSSDRPLKIGKIGTLDFPLRLEEPFLPGDYNGLILVETNSNDESMIDADLMQAVTASFSVIADPKQNIGSSTDSSNAVTETFPPVPDAATPDAATPEAPIPEAPILETPIPEAAVPENNVLPPPTVLTSTLDGAYSIAGTITIDSVAGFENGKAVNLPRMMFDIPNKINAPGPFLYLSKRPYSETRDSAVTAEDLSIPIDEGTNGYFNVQGTFDQFLDELSGDLNDYANGSWIVWCEPFGVYLGGGPISEAI